MKLSITDIQQANDYLVKHAQDIKVKKSYTEKEINDAYKKSRRRHARDKRL